MNRELLKQALYALKYHSIQTRPIDLTDETIEALRQELAKPEQEHMFDTPESHIVKWSIPVDPNNFGEPLAHPEQTETLRVADAIELNVATKVDRLFAANELRRLHDENETLKKCLFQMQNAAIELAKPEQEPAAWMYKGNFHDFDPSEWASPEFAVTPLYTAPPRKPWVGLTNDEINDFSAGCHLGKSVQTAIYQAAAKLKELNT